MTGPACWCHDPIALGHQERCALGLGPVDAGGHGRGSDGLGPPIAGIDYEARYPKPAGLLSDVGFFARTVAAAGAAGWLWSLAEWFMRVDIHV